MRLSEVSYMSLYWKLQGARFIDGDWVVLAFN